VGWWVSGEGMLTSSRAYPRALYQSLFRGHGKNEKQLKLPLPSPPPPSSPEPPTTSLLLRFPWGKREVENPRVLSSFSSRELAFLRWVLRPPISSTKANHLLFLAQPLSYFPVKLIQEGRSKRLRRGPWPIHGYT